MLQKIITDILNSRGLLLFFPCPGGSSTLLFLRNTLLLSDTRILLSYHSLIFLCYQLYKNRVNIGFLLFNAVLTADHIVKGYIPFVILESADDMCRITLD